MQFPIGPTGPIGMAIRDINENLTPIIDFQKLKSNLKDIPDYKTLFKGQNELIMFYELIKGIENGDIDKEKYEKKQMPPMSQCRWRTTFMRYSFPEVLRGLKKNIEPYGIHPKLMCAGKLANLYTLK